MRTAPRCSGNQVTPPLFLCRPIYPRIARYINLITDKGQASVAERRGRAPACKLQQEEGAMSAIIYPVHFQRNFERRWATRMAGMKPRLSRSEGTEALECENVVTAPGDSGAILDVAPIGNIPLNPSHSET